MPQHSPGTPIAHLVRQPWIRPPPQQVSHDLIMPLRSREMQGRTAVLQGPGGAAAAGSAVMDGRARRTRFPNCMTG